MVVKLASMGNSLFLTHCPLYKTGVIFLTMIIIKIIMNLFLSVNLTIIDGFGYGLDPNSRLAITWPNGDTFIHAWMQHYASIDQVILRKPQFIYSI